MSAKIQPRELILNETSCCACGVRFAIPSELEGNLKSKHPEYPS